MTSGGPMSFEEFVREWLGTLVRFGRVLTGDGAAGEDLAQAALVKTYPKWSRISGAPDAYVRRVMVNTHTSWWRRRWRETSVEQTPDPPVRDAAEDVELEQVMWAALARLPARRRAALVLRFYEDLAIDEIADVLGCRTGTAKSLVSRGLATMRQAPELAGRDWGDEVGAEAG